MSLDEHGFLGTQIDSVSVDIYNNNQNVFDICFSLNHFAQKMKYNFRANLDDSQQTFASCLLTRILNGF